MILDHIALSIRHKKLEERLLQEQHLLLDHAIMIYRTIESSSMQQIEITNVILLR